MHRIISFGDEGHELESSAYSGTSKRDDTTGHDSSAILGDFSDRISQLSNHSLKLGLSSKLRARLSRR
jgi:hypothetical protein